MKDPVIRLIDLGLDDYFKTSMSFAQSLIDSINVSGPRARVEYVRSTDMALVAHALTVPAQLIHIMAHGDKSPGDIALGGIDRYGYADPAKTLRLDQLAQYLQRAGEGIEAAAVFVDACNSAQATFTKAFRDSLETPIVYIGATRTVDWHECTTFDSILYGSMLRKKGRGFDAADWVFNAAELSIESYQTAVDGRCPFKVMDLNPSATAKKAFANARRGRSLVDPL